jgi:hypothetical protein
MCTELRQRHYGKLPLLLRVNIQGSGVPRRPPNTAMWAVQGTVKGPYNLPGLVSLLTLPRPRVGRS